MWKRQFEENAKGKAKGEGSYYVVNQEGKGAGVDYIPAIGQDIVMAKARIRKYKKRVGKIKKHTPTKRRRGKKVSKKSPGKRKTKRKTKKRK